jgi:hypothetical protein
MKLTLAPKTYEQALAFLLKSLNAEDIAYIREGNNISHHGFGTAIRNTWNLWGARKGASTALRDEFVSRFKLGHADDMSGFILSHVEAIVNDKAFLPRREIDIYHEHWRKMGIDPVTQERVTDSVTAPLPDGFGLIDEFITNIRKVIKK